MIKLRSITLTILFALVFYVLADKSGIIDEINNAVHERNGWKQVHNGYSKTEIKVIKYIHVSFLKDPEKKDFNIYQGTMKKDAVDRMKHIEDNIIEFDSDEKVVREVLQDKAKALGANTVIINSMYNSVVTVAKGFGIGTFSRN